MHSTAVHLAVFLAQTDINSAITSFKTFLARILMLVGVIVIAYGGYLISRRGELLEGLLCLLAGLILACAVPMMTYLASIAGMQF